MTNKRKHQLERVVRYEYKCFDSLCYPKDNSKRILRHISKLLEYKICYLSFRNTISINEEYFMNLCNNLYYIYYINYIDNVY